jgi:type IV pilus assembly protein PilC
MSVLISSGLEVREAVSISVDASSEKRVSLIATQVARKLDQGLGFGAALATIISGQQFELALIDIGESTGNLQRVLKQLVTYHKGSRKIQEKVRNALWYPGIIFVLLVSLLLGVKFFIMPGLLDMALAFGDSASELKANLVGLDMFLSASSWGILIIVGLIICLQILQTFNRSTRMVVDKIKLRLPVFGRMNMSTEMVRIFFGLETLAESGVNIRSSMLQIIRLSKNECMKDILRKVSRHVVGGQSIAQAFRTAGNGLVPNVVIQWLTIGEKTGSTVNTFSQLRNWYEDRIGENASRISVIIEPAVTLITGIIVVIFVITFIIPLFSVYATAI